MSTAVPMPIRRGSALFLALALAIGAVLPLAAPSATRAAPTELFFSEYLEGSGNNKALEIFNGTGAPVNVLTGGYNIQMHFNGNPVATLTIQLDGTTNDVVPNRDVFVIAQSAADLAGITGQADQFEGSGWFNGDDAVVLRKGTTVLDVIGQIGFDPGTEWGSGLASTGENTIQRFACVHAGDANGANAFDPAVQWNGFAQNNTAGLGAHNVAADPCSTDPTGEGSATPPTVVPGGTTTLTVVVTPGAQPTSTGITVEADLTDFGGSSTQAFAAGSTANTFIYELTVPAGTTPDGYTIPVTIRDLEGRDSTTTIALTVGSPPQIAEIQGAGHLSDMVGESVNGVEGVVTAIRGSSTSGGFWMADPSPDTEASTSDGIFVFNRTTPAVEVGDLVLVNGTVQEFRPFFEDLTITRLSNVSWTVVSSGNEIDPTIIGVDRMPPTLIISDDSTNFVEDSPFDPESDGIDFWETLEGMRLSVADAIAVGPTNNFGELTVVSQLQTDAGVKTPRGGVRVRNLTGTGDYQPGDFNPERLILDDLLSDTPSLNVGDEFVDDPVGVLDQSFGAFKLLVTADPGRVDNGLQREAAAASGPRELAVATFNVENLSARDCVNEPDKVAGLAGQIVNSLRSPDLIAIEEMQDNSGDEDDTPNGDDGTVASDASWQCLIDAIVVAGGPLYDYRQIDPLNNVDGGVPGGNIRVGFLFHSERGLEFVDRPGGTAENDTDVVSTPNGKGAQLTISPGRVLDSDLGGAKAFADTRKSLAGEFRFRGETIFVVANHFSSKGDDRPLFSHFQPPFRLTEFESGDPEDGWRHAQAQAINDFVDEILAVDEEAHVIVLGDINDFDFSETVGVLTGELVAIAGPADADGSGPTAAGGDPVMATLFDLLPADERYSYVFEGNSQVLDQILVSNSLLDLEPTYDVVHVNAEFWDQVSDHDPSVMKVSFQPPASD